MTAKRIWGHLFALSLSPFFQSYNFCILKVGEEGVLETCRYLGPSAPDIPWSHSSLLLPCFSAINNNKKPCTDTPGTQQGSLWMFVDWLTECMQMLSPRLPEELSSFGFPKSSQNSVLFSISLKLIMGWEWREEHEAPSMRPLKNNSRSPRTSCIYTITWGGCQVSPIVWLYYPHLSGFRWYLPLDSSLDCMLHEGVFLTFVLLGTILGIAAVNTYLWNNVNMNSWTIWTKLFWHFRGFLVFSRFC